jgi:hypothetical protein
MNDWMREVDYATYCPKCKNFKVLETDEPCNECLTECAREGTKKPVKFEEKPNSKLDGWPYRVVAFLNEVIDIFVQAITEDFL